MTCIDSGTSCCQYSAVPDDDRYSLTELADLASVTPRTVRYYLAQGLLPAVGQSGPGSKYGDGHLARLRLIRRLQTEHLPLAEIRRRLAGLSDADIEALAATDVSPPPTDSALDYLRTVLGGPTTPLLRLAERPPPMPAMAPPPGMPDRLLRRSNLSEAVLPVPSIPAEAEPPAARSNDRNGSGSLSEPMSSSTSDVRSRGPSRKGSTVS